MAEDSCYPRKQRQRKHGCKHGSFQNGKNKLLKGWGVRSKKANEEMALYNLTMKVNRLELLKANIGLEMIAGTDELDKYMAEILQGRTEDELKRMGGILGKSVKANSKKAAAIPNASFHNATFSDRIWMYQDLLKADLSKLLQTGLIQGKNPRVLARELKKAFDTTTYNAERLMRTELARVQTEAQKQSFQRNGFSLYEYIANINCCDICQGLNGKHFKVESMMPGENAPPMHPHCRCSTAAWEDSEEYNAWVDYLASGGTTEKWNASEKFIFKSIRRHKRNQIGGTTGKWNKTLENSKNSSKIKLGNADVRKWYISEVGSIKNSIDKSLPIEEQARQAFEARNRIRTEARNMMADEETRKLLDKERPNKTFEELIESKMKRKGMTREEAIFDILETATKTNEDVNKELGLGDD